MTPREAHLWTLIDDLCVTGMNAVVQPSAAARAELRRSIERVRSWRRYDRELRRAEALAPRDPRPAPPPDPDDAPPAPEIGRRVYRPPYKED